MPLLAVGLTNAVVNASTAVPICFALTFSLVGTFNRLEQQFPWPPAIDRCMA